MNQFNRKTAMNVGQMGRRSWTREASFAPPPPDPEALYSGKCWTCNTVIEVLGSEVVRTENPYGAEPEPGVWHDLLRAECPVCRSSSLKGIGCTVHVMRREDFQRCKPR